MRLCWIIVTVIVIEFISREICLPRKAFLTFSFTKGRQAPFQLVLKDEEELSPRVKLRPLSHRMCEFYQLSGEGGPTCGGTCCIDLQTPRSSLIRHHHGEQTQRGQQRPSNCCLDLPQIFGGVLRLLLEAGSAAPGEHMCWG